MFNLSSLGKIEGLNLKLNCSFDGLGCLDVNELYLSFKSERHNIAANISLSNAKIEQIGADCNNFKLQGSIKGNSFVEYHNYRINILENSNIMLVKENGAISIVIDDMRLQWDNIVFSVKNNKPIYIGITENIGSVYNESMIIDLKNCKTNNNIGVLKINKLNYNKYTEDIVVCGVAENFILDNLRLISKYNTYIENKRNEKGVCLGIDLKGKLCVNNWMLSEIACVLELMNAKLKENIDTEKVVILDKTFINDIQCDAKLKNGIISIEKLFFDGRVCAKIKKKKKKNLLKQLVNIVKDPFISILNKITEHGQYLCGEVENFNLVIKLANLGELDKNKCKKAYFTLEKGLNKEKEVYFEELKSYRIGERD